MNSMPFDESNSGGLSGDGPRDEVAADVQRQVIELTQRRYQPAIRHEMLRLLQQRRMPLEKERASSGADLPITPFDFLPVEVGFDTLFVRGELLITGRSYDGRGASAPSRGPDRYAQPYLNALHMEVSEVDCAELRDRVLRLTSTEMGPQELADVARVLRARGFAVSLSCITPSAGVIKPPPTPVPPPPAPTPPPPGPGPVPPPGEAAVRPERPGRGEPVRVAVIDTGITEEKRADGLLANILRTPANIDPLDTFPLPHGDGYLDFDAGHGTFAAGIVQQVAPEAEITAYRVVDCDGIAPEPSVACAIIRAVMEGAQIVNLSLGCQTQDDTPPVGLQQALEVVREINPEALIVAAAGNFADSRPCWPAAFRGVVSVAALTPDLMPAPWSSRGFWVTCSAVGQGIRSTFVEGKLSPLESQVSTVFGPDSLARWSGTSFTAPQVVGAIARLCQAEGIRPRAALRQLLAVGTPLPDFGSALRILPGL